MDASATDALTVTDLGVVHDDFRSDVLSGLSLPQKQIASKYFYDQRGSQLFDEITKLEEYYPTRTEISIMRDYQQEIDDVLGPRALIVEYGSGSSTKTRLLLDRLVDPAGYVPIDISRAHLLEAATAIADEYPHLEVLPVVADYTADIQIPKSAIDPARIVVYFPGSTIGNFDHADARSFLEHAADVSGPGGAMLIGVDLVKDIAVLENAYDDAEGVTAAFNLNLLTRINRELGADFDLDGFRHRAVWVPEFSRIEMHLVSTRDQRVDVGGEAFAFTEGEYIHTENSHKFSVEAFADLARPSFELERVWTDARRYFSLQYLVRR